MIPLTRIIGIRVRVIGRSRVEVLDIIDFTRVLEKRTPNLTIQSHMFNRTINFTWGRGNRIHSINIHTVQPLSHSINFSRKQSKCINFKLISNPFRLASFGRPSEIVERLLLNQIIGLVFNFIHQLLHRSWILRVGLPHYRKLEQSSIFEDHGESINAANPWTVPSLIERLIISLSKVGNLIP